MPKGRHRPERNSPAALLAALGDPTRLLILRALAGGAMRPLYLARDCGEEVANVSHHLLQLKRAGWVTASGPRHRTLYALALGERMKVSPTALELTHASGLKVTLSLT
jgi:DNA-binding transcriptional ArsR family regulator